MSSYMDTSCLDNSIHLYVKDNNLNLSLDDTEKSIKIHNRIFGIVVPILFDNFEKVKIKEHNKSKTIFVNKAELNRLKSECYESVGITPTHEQLKKRIGAVIDEVNKIRVDKRNQIIGLLNEKVRLIEDSSVHRVTIFPSRERGVFIVHFYLSDSKGLIQKDFTKNDIFNAMKNPEQYVTQWLDDGKKEAAERYEKNKAAAGDEKREARPPQIIDVEIEDSESKLKEKAAEVSDNSIISEIYTDRSEAEKTLNDLPAQSYLLCNDSGDEKKLHFLYKDVNNLVSSESLERATVSTEVAVLLKKYKDLDSLKEKGCFIKNRKEALESLNKFTDHDEVVIWPSATHVNHWGISYLMPGGEQKFELVHQKEDIIDVINKKKLMIRKEKELVSEISFFTSQIEKNFEGKGTVITEEQRKTISTIVRQALQQLKGGKFAQYEDAGFQYRARIKTSKNNEQTITVLKKRTYEGKVGEGSFGIVYKWEKVHNIGFKAIKSAKGGFHGQVVLEEEFEIHRITNENKKAPPSIQKALKNPVIDQYGSKVQEVESHFYPGGDLSSKLNKHEQFPLEKVEEHMKEMVSALLFFKEQGILHADIKGANIFIDENGKFVIADLGGAKKIFLNMPDRRGILSPLFSLKTDMEAVEKAKDENTLKELQSKRQVYSTGLVVFQMLTGLSDNELESFYDKLMFAGSNDKVHRDGIKLKKGVSSKDFIKHFEGKLKDANVQDPLKTLVLGMIHPDIEKRMTAEQVAEKLS